MILGTAIAVGIVVLVALFLLGLLAPGASRRTTYTLALQVPLP